MESRPSRLAGGEAIATNEHPQVLMPRDDKGLQRHLKMVDWRRQFGVFGGKDRGY